MKRDTKNKGSSVMVSVNYARCLKQTHCDKCRYAERHYVECRGAKNAPRPIVFSIIFLVDETASWQNGQAKNPMINFVHR